MYQLVHYSNDYVSLDYPAYMRKKRGLLFFVGRRINANEHKDSMAIEFDIDGDRFEVQKKIILETEFVPWEGRETVVHRRGESKLHDGGIELVVIGKNPGGQIDYTWDVLLVQRQRRMFIGINGIGAFTEYE